MIKVIKVCDQCNEEIDITDKVVPLIGNSTKKALGILTKPEFVCSSCKRIDNNLVPIKTWEGPEGDRKFTTVCEETQEECWFWQKCANHASAGEHRSEGGLTPTLRMKNGVLMCDKRPERRGRQAIS